MSELTKFPQRINFADAKARPEYPDFLEVAHLKKAAIC